MRPRRAKRSLAFDSHNIQSSIKVLVYWTPRRRYYNNSAHNSRTLQVDGTEHIIAQGAVSAHARLQFIISLNVPPTVVVFDDEAPDLPSLPGVIALSPFLDKSRISRTPDIVDSDSPPPSTTPRGRSSPEKMKESDLFNVSEDERLDREPEPPSGGSRHRRRARDTRPSRPPETLSQGKSSSSYERSSPDLKKKAKESSWTSGISSWAQGPFRRLSHPGSSTESSDQRRRGDAPGPGHPPRAATEGTQPTGNFGAPVFSKVPRTARMDPNDSRYTRTQDARGR